jgi:hypothetical protein
MSKRNNKGNTKKVIVEDDSVFCESEQEQDSVYGAYENAKKKQKANNENVRRCCL